MKEKELKLKAVMFLLDIEISLDILVDDNPIVSESVWEEIPDIMEYIMDIAEVPRESAEYSRDWIYNLVMYPHKEICTRDIAMQIVNWDEKG